MNDAHTLKYVYAGNRPGVLEKMLSLGLNVSHLIPMADSHLHRNAGKYGIETTVVTDRTQCVHLLQTLTFDILVSSGLGFVLPVSKLTGEKRQLYLNVHPSYLPDLRGRDPIPGAILHRRDSGVTVHQMDDGIDTGKTIAAIKLPYHPDYDASTLYDICFRLEPIAFENAFANNFRVAEIQPTHDSPIYYSFKQHDLECVATDSSEMLMARVKAFNTAGKKAVISIGGRTHQIRFLRPLPLDAENSFPLKTSGRILWKRANVGYFFHHHRLWQLESLQDLSAIGIGDKVFT
jgi:methionyl-tRNA formyltransferase